MKGSVLDRFGLEEYRKIREQVVYDPSAANGLRWLYTKSGRRSTEVGKGFWIDGVSYQAAWVVLILNDHWPEEGQNVAKRIDPSGPWSDVNNLEWGVHGDSRRQSAEQKRAELVVSVLGHDEPFIDDRHRLNFLCANNHQWNSYPLSLQARKGKGWKCEECEKERKSSELTLARHRAYREANAEVLKVKDRERYESNKNDPEWREARRQRQRVNVAKYRATHGRESRSKNGLPYRFCEDHGLPLVHASLIAEMYAGGLEPDAIRESLTLRESLLKSAGSAPSVARLVMEEQRRHWQENPEAKAAHDRWWKSHNWWLRYQINPELRLYTRQKSKRRKAQMRNSVAIQVSGQEISARFAKFDHRCAYCGAGGDLHIEHVVPISRGGGHAIGNIVPACESCNYSKRDHQPETWYRRQPFFSELRWRKICRVLGWQRSSVGQLALL
jgi:5-methylcytosine-specific restriction endonuclease McrA